MNRFRGRKKNRDQSAATARPSTDSEPSGPFRMFSKKKTQEEVPKKELDLSGALPPTDDFRTSLLMTGLSARFSMLREQDDPNSKLGKASDDSVLCPKRHLRPMEFGLGAGLHDIAEIESIKSRPFARVDSCISSDDAASTNGSVINRAKPNEGNNLFGGRQKIYKIPAGSTSKGGGMSGRALYDDDVAQSAFQKWRQAEKNLQSLPQDQNHDMIESDAQLDYNRRRETNSTTSSAPSAGRNSTAATSITSSQPSSSVKDWQPASVATSSASQAASLERSVTRTRRLYEHGLTQDLQDQQSSALSRIDTLSRQRPLGSWTPDLSPPVPSPTNTGFGDRVLELRPIMSKASAPNLRSFSPPTTSSAQLGLAETSSKSPMPEQNAIFGASPPLSPPISETEDHPMLPIQPKDRGKATAMGVFSRPAQQYDEFKYAQRQRQLQQGREPPGGQAASEPSDQVARSRSSSAHRKPLDRRAMVPVTLGKPCAQKDGPHPTFYDESDDGSVDNRSGMPGSTPQLSIERPADQDHPAFRKSALPTPLSVCSSRSSDDAATLPRKAGAVGTPAKLEDSQDSPILGANSGLSGIVRQHLRHESAASSMFAANDEKPVESSADAAEDNTPGVAEVKNRMTTSADGSVGSHDARAKEQDEFARHLADGARRVRERLTSYVESDNERSAPPTPLVESSKDFDALRPDDLGILRSKSSRGSLLERENIGPNRSRSVMDAPPRRPSAKASEDMGKNGQHQSEEESADKGSPGAGKDENVHAGLKAFRQARRELQRMKELEIQQRHLAASQKVAGPADRPAPQVPSRAGGPPPVMFNRGPRDETENGNRSGAGSRAASERGRSGSEASTGGQTYTRGPRLRNGSAGVAFEEQHGHNGAGGGLSRPSPSMRAAGFPGADVRQSPPHSSSPRAFPLGMSPSHGTSVVDPRRMTGRKRDVSDPNFGSPSPQGPNMRQAQHKAQQPYSRSRNGSLLGGAVSTPNLHAVAAAPPLPPINPRRKNGQGGFARPSEEGGRLESYVPLGAHEEMYGGSSTMSDDDGVPDMYRRGGRRMGPEGNSRLRHSPPRGAVRPRPPHPNMASGGLPGGMI